MIQIKDLHKSFGTQKVLRGLNLTLDDGKITVILGPSGTGKSVLLKIMIGLIKPDQGEVLVDDEDICTLNPVDLNEIRRKFGMLFQSAALFDSMSVEDNIAFPLREHSDKNEVEIKKIVREKLSLVELTGAEKKFPSELSGGMRKRVGLARAIALEPRIVLYDEPTTGLDPLTCESINDLIVAMQERLHVTSVIISHDIESTFEVAHKIAMLHEGQIVEEGSPDELRHSKNPIVQGFIGRGHVT
jgi:phospholipid/cholesterol/gamma-HCH transport system ATP-binding protein